MSLHLYNTKRKLLISMSEGPAFNYILRLSGIVNLLTVFGATLSAKQGINLHSEPFKGKDYFHGDLI